MLVKARVDTLPSNLSDEDRVQWIDNIILDEAEKLQKKYRTVYYGSDNILTSIFSPGLHNKLKPLFTEYPTKETQTDPLFEAATNGLSAGFKAGLWAEALKGISPKGGGSTVISSVDDVMSNPQNLFGKSKADVSKILGDGWTEGAYGSSKTGWKFTKGDQSIFYHPGGGRHGGSYYGYSSGATGKIKIVGPDYVPISGDKATIIKGY